MKYYYEFSDEKNEILLHTRGVCFEDVIELLYEGKVLDTVSHPYITKYPNQSMYIVEINNYCYLVPYVKNENKIFLKTIIPNREASKKYLRSKNE